VKIPHHVFSASYKKVIASGKQAELEKIKDDRFRLLYPKPREFEKEKCLQYQKVFENIMCAAMKQYIMKMRHSKMTEEAGQVL